jgi:hypothetical protein
MKQCLQHAESAPMGHAFMFWARSNAISTPSLRAFNNICWVAEQVVKSLTGTSFFSFFLIGSFFTGIVPPFMEKVSYLNITAC